MCSIPIEEALSTDGWAPPTWSEFLPVPAAAAAIPDADKSLPSWPSFTVSILYCILYNIKLPKSSVVFCISVVTSLRL